MNGLMGYQIHYKKIHYKHDRDYFKISFISNRLYSLICYKMSKGNWIVMQLELPHDTFLAPGYRAVLTAPSKKSVLFIKEK
jgi:hypothetical protein